MREYITYYYLHCLLFNLFRSFLILSPFSLPLSLSLDLVLFFDFYYRRRRRKKKKKKKMC